MWTGTCRDTLVQTPDGWRFALRQLTMDPTDGGR